MVARYTAKQAAHRSGAAQLARAGEGLIAPATGPSYHRDGSLGSAGSGLYRLAVVDNRGFAQRRGGRQAGKYSAGPGRSRILPFGSPRDGGRESGRSDLPLIC
jgi:hypothetical protein